MRIAITLLLLLAVAALVAGALLLAPRFAEPASPRLAEEKKLLEMMASAPDDAEQVVAIPTFAATWRRFEPLIAPLLESAEDASALAGASWLLGNARVVIWTTEDGWGAVADPDALHRLVLRVASGFVSADVAFEPGRVVFGKDAPSAGGLLDPSLASTLAGHFFLVHGREGSYPPMGRPAITAARFDERSIDIVTRGTPESDGSADPLRLEGMTLPANALLAARFAETPKAVLAIEKTAPIRFERFLSDGALVALYGVEEGGLIPRPLVAFSVPSDDAKYEALVAAVDRAMAKGAVGLLLGAQPERTREVGGITITHREGLGLTLEYARRGDELLFAFDDVSLERLLGAELVPAGEGRATWAMRARPAELLPVLDELGSSRGIRLLARGVSNSSRDLARALRALPPTEELQGEMQREGDVMVFRARATLAGGQEEVGSRK